MQCGPVISVFRMSVPLIRQNSALFVCKSRQYCVLFKEDEVVYEQRERNEANEGAERESDRQAETDRDIQKQTKTTTRETETDRERQRQRERTKERMVY